MIKKIYVFAILAIVMLFSVKSAEAQQVEFKVEILPDNVTYQVSMRPTVTWNYPQNITSSAQVTVKAPSGGFTVGNVQSLVNSTSWVHNSTYTSPAEDTSNDYFSFGLTSLGTDQFSYNAGVSTPIFTFENTGTCTGAVEMMPLGDPFYPPNSESANVGNQITTFGGGQNNAWLGNYDVGSANCGGDPVDATCSVDDVTTTPETDCNEADGTLTISATGSSSLEYSIDNGASFQTSNVFNGLSGGDYDVVVRLSGGTCTSVFSGNSVTVGSPVAPFFSSINSQNPSDCGSSDGSINLTAQGGTGNFQYSIDGASYSPTGNFTGLAPGTYNIAVRNSDGTCEVLGNPITLSAPSSPFFNTVNSTGPSSCGVSDGTITITATGGTGSYQYSINGTNFFPSGEFTGLPQGSYPVAIKNIDGSCQVNGATVVLSPQSGLTVDVTKTDPSDCGFSDGEIQITVSGGSGNYLYSIDNGASWSSNSTFSGLPDNNYTVLAKNNDNSCESAFSGNPVQLNEPNCVGGCAVEYVLEAMPDGRYQVSVLPNVTWENPDNFTSTAQITVVAPTGGFAVDNLQNLVPGATFEYNAIYTAPTENPGFDYFVFGLTTQGTSGISYEEGVQVPLFIFENGGICTGQNIFLFDNANDPFAAPNSQNGNVGQQLSTLGGGMDVSICTATSGVPCQVPYVSIECLLAYELEVLPSGAYQVSMIPDTTWNSPDNVTSTAQVTVVSPTGSLVVSNLTNLISGVEFENNATYVTPSENPDEDYFVFGLTTLGTSDIPYVKGQKVPLFTFENDGVCTGDSLYLMPIEGDPFAEPNSENANVGQQLTTSGSGPDANICIFGESAACLPCGANALDTDGDGICDAEENNNGSDPFDPCSPSVFGNNCNYVCPDAFASDYEISQGPADICTQIDPTDWNIYTITVDGQEYTGDLAPCDNDTMLFYTYAYTAGQGNEGPYEITWSVNGIPNNTIVADMTELAIQMNSWDNGGNWLNDAAFAAVSGGQDGVMYGDMEITQVSSGIPTYVQTNYTYESSGTIVSVEGAGLHEIIATHDNGCVDTMYVEIFMPTIDTLYEVFTWDSTATNFCVNNDEIAPGTFTASVCGDPANGQLTNNGDGCYTYVPEETFLGTDEMCVVVCSDTDPAICDTTIVFIEVDQIICYDIFDTDTIYLAGTNGSADLCMDITAPEVNTFEAYINGIQYPDDFVQCDLDTLVFYSYAFVIDQNSTGPYEIMSWEVNGSTFSTTVNDMTELTAWMNQVGVMNNWVDNPAFAAISGGNPSIDYGEMKIRHIASSTPTVLQPSYTTLVSGSEITINGLGEHEVIMYDTHTGCADTAIVYVVEPDIDTTTVFFPLGETATEICLDTDEMPGNPASITICENPGDGSVTLTGLNCISYDPNPGFIGEDAFCVIICDDSPTAGPFCDTTYVTVIVPPTTDYVGPITIDQVDPSVICVDSVLQYPAMMVSSDICGEDLAELNATNATDGCIIIEPVLDFVGFSEICMTNCYESAISGTQVCDTTIVTVFVPPSTDTVEITVNEWVPFDICLTDDINLAGNIDMATVCGENPEEVDMTVTSMECVNLSPTIGFQGLSELCIVHCDDSNPAICDTTIILVNVDVPCPEIFEEDIIYTAVEGVCVPIPSTEIGAYSMSVDGAEYTLPIEGCNLDTVVYYSYAFTEGQGDLGPYEVTAWTVNGITYGPATVQDMDELADQMNLWNPNSEWVHNDTSSSIRNEVMGDDFGNMEIRRVLTQVETTMLPNFTEVALGSFVHLDNAGLYQVAVMDTLTNCADTVSVLVVETQTDTTVVTVEPHEPSDPICIDNGDMPGNVSVDFCGGATAGTFVFNDLNCLIYESNPGFSGIDEVCVVSCSDVVTAEGAPLCDTTIIQILVLPHDDETTETIPPAEETEICLTTLEFPSTIISSGVCNQNTDEVSVTTDNTPCISVDPVDDFVGVSPVCVYHCYEELGIQFCDTTIVNVVVLPPTDTVEITLVGFEMDTVCLSDYPALQLPGNLIGGFICNEDTSVLDAEISDGDCVTLDPEEDYLGTTEVCVIHCDDTNPQICDTTILMVTVLYPCEEYFESDTIVINDPQFCTPIPVQEYTLSEIILDGIDYTFPAEPCEEDSLVYYTYSFATAAGEDGPYAVHWELNNVDYSGVVQDMDGLATLMNQWDSSSNEWSNDPATTSVRREHTEADYGELVLTHLATSAPAFLNANYTTVAYGSIMTIEPAGWHELVVTNVELACTDTVQIFYFNNDTETMELVVPNATTSDEVCMDISGLPGNVASVSLCSAPLNGSVSFNGECATYTPNGFFAGNDQFCVVVCDDNGAPYGQICDTTYIHVTVEDPICDPLFDSNSVTIEESSGNGTGFFCAPILPLDLGDYEVSFNGGNYTGPMDECDVDEVVFYSYSGTTGAGADGPYEMTSWEVNGTTFNGLVSDMDALANLMNQIDPNGNWTNNPGSSNISGGAEGSVYGDMILTHQNSNTPANLTPNYTYVVNGTSFEMPLGTNTLTFYNTTNGCVDEIEVTVTAIPNIATVAARVYLQGAYNEYNPLMNDDLRALSYIPLTEPYTDHNPIPGVYNFNHVNGGGETTTSSVMLVNGPDAIVDWVFMELRSAADPTQVVATRSALLQRDGDIVDVDGFSPVQFAAAPDDYHLAIRHRNHLGIMSADAFALSLPVTSIDFTDNSTPTFGTAAQKEMPDGQYVMWGGDTNSDGNLTFQGSNNDPDAIFFQVLLAPDNTNYDQNFIFDGYNSSDANMDGHAVFQGSGNDIDFMIFFNIMVHPSSGFVINYVIAEQLP